MMQENKQLLIQDLCTRLPYHPKCKVIDEIRVVNNEKDSSYISTLFPKHIELLSNHNDFTIKPYLRSMSSMTEEEIIEFNNIPSTKNYQIVKGDLPWDVAHYKQIDWLNAYHFDYRGLIDKGLAIKVTREYNPYKNIKL